MANAYGNYADVLDPIKISTDIVGVVSTENYLRNYCIVSCGDSTIGTGNIQMVTQATYQNYLVDTTGADSELEKAIKGYFALSGQFCFIIEVGAYSISNNTKAQVDILESYINAHPKKMYMFGCPHDWYYPEATYNVVDETAPALHISPTTATLTALSSLTLDIAYYGTISYTRGTDFDTYFTFDEGTGVLTSVSSTQGSTTLQISVTQGTETLTQTLTLSVGDTGSVSGEYTQNFTYERDLAFLNLTTSQPDAKFIITGNAELPDGDEGWALYKEKENIMVVYDNSNVSANGFPLYTAILGIMGSTKYDITTSNGMTPLNNKSMAGVSYTDLGYTKGETLIQAPQNIMGDFAGNTVLFNGLFADGRSFEFRYSIDLMNYEIDLSLKSLLYNSSNASTYALTYDQNGIDTINATIIATLNKLQDMNVINTYAAGYNTITNSMVNEGYINCIEFYTYKASYPENYAAGIYGGISFYVLIQGFIKEIQLKITIE